MVRGRVAGQTGKKWYGAPEKAHPLDLLLQLHLSLAKIGMMLPVFPAS
jgi:hypothetical protein